MVLPVILNFTSNSTASPFRAGGEEFPLLFAWVHEFNFPVQLIMRASMYLLSSRALWDKRWGQTRYYKCGACRPSVSARQAFWHPEIGSACEEERCGPACGLLTQETADKAHRERGRHTETRIQSHNYLFLFCFVFLLNSIACLF